MAVAVATLPRPFLHAASIARRSIPTRQIQRAVLSRLRTFRAVYAITLLRSLRLTIFLSLRSAVRRSSFIVSRQISRLARPSVANRLLHAQVRARLRVVLKRLLQQLALRIVLGLLPGIGSFSPMLLNAVSGLVGSAAGSASSAMSAHLVGYLPQDFGTRSLELVRVYAEVVREEVAGRVNAEVLLEYFALVRDSVDLDRLGGLSLERIGAYGLEAMNGVDLEMVRAMMGEMLGRTAALVTDLAVKPSPKALLQ